jgi:hypothetical protein
MFIAAACFQTSQDLHNVVGQGLLLMASKILVDYTKHYFLTRFNKINIVFYEALRLNMLKRIYQLRTGEEDKFKEFQESKAAETA